MRRPPTAVEATRARDKDGVVNVYAVIAARRFHADAYYLAHWRELGPAEAARKTCRLYGHLPHGPRCERCGEPIRRVSTV